MSATMLDSGSDSALTHRRAPAGVGPSRTWPPSVPPAAPHIACTTRDA